MISEAEIQAIVGSEPLGGWDPNPHPDEVHALFLFFSDQIDAAEAARRFTKFVKQSYFFPSEDSPAEVQNRVDDGLHGGAWAKFSGLWNIIHWLAIERVELEDKLVELLVAISELPDLEIGGESVSLEGAVVFRGLPGWDTLFYEVLWNQATDYGTIDDSEYSETLPVAINLNTFIAKLTAHPRSACRYTSWVMHDLASMLEDDPWNTGKIASADSRLVCADSDETTRKAACSLAHLETKIKVLSPWFLYASPRIIKLNGTQSSDNCQSDWKERGYCSERWNFWIQRWEWIASEPDISPGCQNIAKEVLVVMKATS